jgi:hypothetical protein
LPKPPSRLTATVLVATMIVVPTVLGVGVLLVRSPARPVASTIATPPAPTPGPSAETPPDAAVNQQAEILGRILDADGNPAQGAAVHALSVGSPSRILADTISDAGGRFSFDRLAEPIVRVVADHEPDGFAISASLRVVEGRSVELTLVLSAAGAILGTVVDGADHPVVGATVAIDGLPWLARKATSDAAGAFRLAAVPTETPTVVAFASGYRAARVPLPRRDEATDVTIRVRLDSAPPVLGDVHDPDGKPVHARVVACEGQPSEARVESGDDGTFQLPASTFGCGAVAQHDDYGPSDPATVTEGRRLLLELKAGGAIEGTVVDDRGAAVTAFSVGIESFAGAQKRGGGNGGARKVEDPGGAFRWDRLAPGDYVLSASAQDKPPARSDPIAVTAGATAHARIVLAQGGTVVGRVTDERRAPLADVTMTFDTVSSVVGSTASAKTDASGQYRLDGAPSGTPFTLRAQKDGFRVHLISALRVDPRGTLTQNVVLTSFDGGPGLELGGIGANVVGSPDGIAFGAIYPGDPADRAGLKAGDRVTRVDGEDTDHMSVADAIQRLRGEVGTTVGVSVARANGETLDVFITRGTIVH